MGTRFEGDPTDIAELQNDVYWDALRIIVGNVHRHYRNASAIVGNGCELPRSYDHRCFQMAHDAIAAAWRFQCEVDNLFAQDRDRSMVAWLEWLRSECDHWCDEPEIVRTAAIILRNQNNDLGYEAEKRLSVLLELRFSNVPCL